VIAVATASQKGGVGKTTLCVNLAYSLARRGWNTVLVDTDPQGAVGLSLAKSSRVKPGFYDLMSGGLTLAEVMLTTRLPELSIVPAGRHELCARRGLDPHSMPERLADLLRAAELRGADIVLLDTAAGISGVSEMVVKGSDFVILPQQAEPLAVRSLPHLLEGLARFRREGAGVKVAGILLTMVMQDHGMSARVEAELRGMLPENMLFSQSIPRRPAFLEASGHGVPVALLHRNPPPEALIFDHIAAELEQRTGLDRAKPEPATHASLLD
jgi:chromosome partitioning protein